MVLKRKDVIIWPCDNKEADRVFLAKYWLKRLRYSKRLSYSVFLKGEKVAWVQVADPFGTKLPKNLQNFDINEAVEVCRGYFIDSAPTNIESCAIAKILRKIPNDWYECFGVIKKIAVIYQDLDYGQKGIVYKALGFKSFGYTSNARHYKKTSRGDSNGRKMVWARALRPISGHITKSIYNYVINYSVFFGELPK